MKRFVAGILLGVTLTGAVAWGGNFYDQSGKPNAPRGSIESFDYFRQRQQFLDLGAMRRNSDAARAEDPCGRGR